MRHWSCVRLAVVVALVVLGLSPHLAFAQAEYTFTTLLDSSQGLTPTGCATINDNGQVAFAVENFDTGLQQIMRAETDGTLTVIADDTKRFSFFGGNPSINNAGDVSFAAGLQKGGEVIVVSDGKKLKTVAQTQRDIYNFFGFNTSLNNRGEVVFSAEFDEEFNFDEGTFVGNGKTVRTIYLASTSQFQGSDTRRSINDSGQIAFEETLDDDTRGIFLFDSTGFVTIVDETSPLVDDASKPQLNNAGVVVFHGFLDTIEQQEQAIITGNGGQLTIVADTTGPFGDLFSFGGPAINDSSAVAFNAALDGVFDAYGIYTGPDPVADRVIGPGDPLDGSTVTSTLLCSEGLNNAGQLAFVAFLEDGRMVIVRTTPTA